MKKFILICIVLLLAACSDSTEKATWVAQNIPNEKKDLAPTYPDEVAVYSPNVNTTGQVIKQKEREKWILVNAQEVAGHPNVLVHNKMLTLGEVVAVDAVNNISLIHIRNSTKYEVAEIVPFTTTRKGEQVTATSQQIEALLQQAIDEPIDWQQRYEKNRTLLEGLERKTHENFTTYYSKNLFTYNSDELKYAAMQLIDTLNKAINQHHFDELNLLISSDDVKEEMTYVTNPINGFKIKEAKRDGVYYFVNGVDENKEDVRLTFILEDQLYKLIGANIINTDDIIDEKIVTIDVIEQKKLSEVPALEMFANKHLTNIKIKTPDLTWQLSYKDNKIAVQKDGKASYSCSEAKIQNNVLTLIGCGPQNVSVPLVKLK
ncbi:hypothetical protein LZ480_12150 [Solibacillus sp. MA9]|uniref:Lipoprotein n=1 Tax=Solibacillus palustris TaxID=2908203 RepID=A0ABS9UEX6_9BACL|nr:hypothetical protein [Solibacillus sp. MA9]MCH7322644.1 hypothetical protein [Solibacillus sp. MA9]